MRSTASIAIALCLAASGAYAGVTINGTTITFNDNTMQSTAATGGGGSAPADHGGTFNTVGGAYSFIGGGSGNTTSGDFSTVGAGQVNTASGYRSTVVVGYYNEAGGYLSTVGGGYGNRAAGNFSFVAGTSANASHANSFVWGGAAGARTSFSDDTFNVWSSAIYLNGSASLTSDRNMKEGFTFVSARAVLDKVVEVPVSTWRFKNEDDSIRHIGPMAQDFMAAFGYGKSDTHITATDADGVAFAAIQGLNAKVEEQAETITALRWHNAQLQAILRARDESLEARFARLEKAILREGERVPASSTD